MFQEYFGFKTPGSGPQQAVESLLTSREYTPSVREIFHVLQIISCLHLHHSTQREHH
jgi:hypothetical protein